MQDTQR